MAKYGETDSTYDEELRIGSRYLTEQETAKLVTAARQDGLLETARRVSPITLLRVCLRYIAQEHARGDDNALRHKTP